MIRFASRVTVYLSGFDRRIDARMRRRVHDDDGFVLLETLVAISLISVVMAAFTTFFINSVANTNQQRAAQAATQLADSAADLIRSVPASDLVSGHDATSVSAQFASAPAAVSPWLQNMVAAVDTTAAANAGRTATIPTVAVNQTVNNIGFGVNSYLGTCVITAAARLNAACGLGTASSGTSYLRAVVAVTWPGAHCLPALCSYVTSTLLSPGADPVFNPSQMPPTVPAINLGNRVSTVGATVSQQLAVTTNTGVGPFTWAVTGGALPAGLGLTVTGLISGKPTVVSPAGTPSSVTITVTDALGRTACTPLTVPDPSGQTTCAPFTWTIVSAPTVTTPANQTTTINTPVSLAVVSSCANTPCTYALGNAPVGLSIDNTGLITGTPTVAGTVSVTVTVTDHDGISATSNAFTWAVLATATVCVQSRALPNGSFEASTISPGAPNWVSGGSSPLIWNTTESDGIIELWGNGGNVQSANNGIPIAAEDGNAWAELNANDVGALYQDLVTTPGQVLQWSVWHRGRGTGSNTGQDVMQVQIGSTTSTSAQVPTGQTTTAISDGPQAWVRYTGVYTVPAGQTTTRFQFAAVSTASGSQSVGNFIDNLSLDNNIACLSGPVTDRTSTVGTAISPVKIAVDRGTAPYVWTGGSSLPTGLSLASDGTMSGTPTATGVYAVVLTFTDASSFTQSVTFNWTVVAKPTVTAPAAQTNSVGASVNLSLASSCPNSPCRYVLNTGPPGLSIDSSGLVTGTITGPAQVYTAAVTVIDAAGAAVTSATFTWTVLAAPTIVTPAAQTTTVGAVVSLSVSSTCAASPCTFTLANAPPGLSINASTGTISGAPSLTGTYAAVTVSITDASGVTVSSGAFTWTVLTPSTITTPSTQTTTVGAAVNLAVGFTCTNPSCAFTLLNAPAGLVISSGGVITGTAPASAQVLSNVTVRITDSSNGSVSTGAFTWNIVARPTITTPAAQTSTVGAAVSLMVASTCPNAPCTFVLVNAPTGLSINGAGLISGTITASAQTFSNVTVRVTDSSGVSVVTAAFSWTVLAAPTIVTPAAQTTAMGATVNLAVSSTCANSPCTFTLANAPPGLSINASSGTISGSPTVTGTYATVTVTITDKSSVTATTGSFSWTVFSQPTITAPPAQKSSVGAVVSLALTTSCPNAPCSYVLNNGPGGLTVNSAGVITGTVTGSPQVFTASVTVTDKSNVTATTGSFSWTVLAAPTITTPGPQTTTVGAAVSLTVAATCANTPCTYVLSNAPTGLTINSSGVISGTVPASAQTFGNVTVRVTDSSSVVATTAGFTWNIVGRPTITTPAAQTTTVGAAVSLAVTSTCANSPCSFALANAPSGLSINASTGVITGAPTVTGTYATVTVTVTDNSGVSVTSGNFTWTVTAAPTVTTPAAQTTTVGASVNLSVAFTCANPSCSFTLLNGPAGLSINSSGVITGTAPATAQVLNNVIVRVTDASNISASTAAFTWNIVARPTVTAPASRTDSVGSPINLTLTKTCPNAPCSYLLNNGPGGLTVSSAGIITGTISGSAQVFGNVTVTVTDSSSVSVTSTAFSWTVLAAPTITTPPAQTTTLGASVSLAVAFTCADGPCSFTLANAPPGLSINSSGVITGTTTLAGTYATVTVTATDVDGSAATTGNFTWTVLARATVTAPANQTSSVGSVVSLALTKTCPNSPCSYQLNNGPPGLTVSSAGVITGTITGSAQVFSTVTITSTDNAGVTVTSGTFSWTVVSAPTITTPGAQTTTVGTAVSLTVAFTCANGPCAFTLANAPPGLTINASTGVISGTATTTGSYAAVTVTITDRGNSAATTSFAWSVVSGPTITTPASQTSTIGGVVNLAVASTCPNTPCTFALANAPPGLSINVNTGAISGSPTSTGTYATVTVTVTDHSGVAATTASFSWTVLAAPTVTKPAAQTSTVGASVNLAITSTCANAPCAFTLTGAPAGLSINASTGAITGSPTTPGSSAAVSVTITDRGGVSASTGNFTWTVVAKPTVTAPANQTHSVGSPVTLALTTTCPNSPCSYVLNNGPSGLSITTAGVITGVITGSAQVFSAVTVTVTDTAGITASSAAFSWTVLVAPTVTTPAAQTTTIGAAANLTVTSTCADAPCTFTLANAPPGLSINSSGVISGTPTLTGTYATVTVTVTDIDGSTATTGNFTWTVLGPPTITTPAAQTTTTGATVNLSVASTCANSPCAFTLTNAPAGLVISAAGVITGTVTSAAQVFSSVTVRITDKAGVSATTAAFTWTIVAKPTVTAPAAQTYSVRSPVNLTLTKSCPNTPCSYVLNNGPAGLTITSAGVITGTITSAAQVFSTVTVTVTDNSGVSASSAAFSWTVLAAPTITTPAAQTTTVGAAVSLAVSSTCADVPCTFTLANAPPGLSINATTGVISGSPSLTGTYAAVTVTVTDVDGSAATTANFSWTVLAGPTVTTPPAQTTTVGTVVSLAVASTCPNSPCGYVLSNAPTGLSINSSGLITGTVTSTPQVFNTVTVTVTDKGGNSATTANFSWTVTAGPTVTKPAAQTSTVGATVSLTLTKTCPNTPCTYVLNNGPAGLTITSAGVVTGTITSAAQVFSSVTVTVTDNSGVSASTAVFTWTVLAKPTVTAPANQTHSVGSPVSLTLTKTCPNTPCGYVLNNGPAGLTITSAGVVTGTITGTAQVFSSVTITVTDNSGVSASSAAFTWTVLAGPTVTTPAAQTTTIGAAVSLTVGSTCADAPCTFTLANAPPGLSISNSGVISGTVTGTAQTYSTVSVRVADVDGASATTANFSWTVTGPPTITSPGSQTLVVGQSIYFTLSYTCPNAPCTFVTTNIPPGLSVDNQGNVQGAPTTVGTYSGVTITVVDASGVRATTGALTVTVIGPPSAPTSPAATGGNAQVTVSWSAPTNTNGSAITGYTATSSPGGATCAPSPATATGCTITGLQNGTTYTITITATNAAGTGPASTAVAATSSASCTSAAVGTGGLAAYLAYPLNETGGLVAADVSGNARSGIYTSGGITYGAAGPCPRDGGKAITLNGSTGAVSSNIAPVNPQVFSVAIWFKATVAGGKLIGLGNAKTGASSQYDRHIYMTNAGTLAFGVYPNGTATAITSPLAYNNGGWHQAIATLAPSTDANPGMRLYVDGRLVVSDPTTTGAEPLTNASYWRIGYDSTSGWPGAPTNSFFTGSLAFAATYTYALTPAQALAQYNAGI